MKKGEPVGEWLKRQGRVHIRYGDAIELIQEIQAKRDNLGLELSEWVEFGDEVIGMVCDLFDIEEPYVGSKRRAAAIKEVKIRGMPEEGNKSEKRKEKLRRYLKESLRLQKKSEELEEQAENYLDIVDHSFTEAQRDEIWKDLGLPPSGVERLTKAVEEMEIEEEVK